MIASSISMPASSLNTIFFSLRSSFFVSRRMGAAAGKGYTRANNKPNDSRYTIRKLRKKKYSQAIAYEDKEAGWKREREMLKEEMDGMRKLLDEKDRRIRRLEEELLSKDIRGSNEMWYLLEVGILLEQMQEEQALRQEAVKKWKGLYLAIKSELDDLILRSCQGEWTSLGAEVEKLQRKLKAREERLAALRSRLVLKEKEVVEKQREMDILKRSIRIMSNKQQATSFQWP